jgi:hypothetical protein
MDFGIVRSIWRGCGAGGRQDVLSKQQVCHHQLDHGGCIPSPRAGEPATFPREIARFDARVVLLCVRRDRLILVWMIEAETIEVA